MQIHTEYLNKEEMPATSALLKAGLGIELPEKEARKPVAKIYAGYEGGYYLIRCEEGIWLSQVAPLFKQGYKIMGWKSMLYKIR